MKRLLVLSLLLLYPDAQMAQSVSVTTQHNDNARSGYVQERLLIVTNVNKDKFGKRFELSVDGDIYGQPLYVPNLKVGTRMRNLVYVATMHNSVYAFDADEMGDGQPIWKTSLEPAVILHDNPDFCQNVCDVIRREIGIVSTPVISIPRQLLYVVTFTGSNEKYSHYLHALDLRTGAKKFSEKRIAATGFNSMLQIQRAALLFANEIVYVAFASYGDCGDYHGWIFGFTPELVQLRTVFNTTPKGAEGGIWQAGQGPAADNDGNIYVMSGNGTFDRQNPPPTPPNVGNSFIKLSRDLSVLDRFTPWNSDELNGVDGDLGSGGPLGPLMLPGGQFLVGGGKEGKLYVLNRSKLGGFSDSEPEEKKRIFQSFQATPARCPGWNMDNFPINNCGELSPAKHSSGYHHIHGSPVSWSSSDGFFVYVWGEADKLRRFKWFNFKFEPSLTSDVTTPTRSMPGAMLSLSANGDDPASGIIWASHPTGCQCSPLRDFKCTDPKNWCDANAGVFPGTLRAINASTLKELWNSDQNAADKLGNVAKFAPVTVANGVVYVATFSNKLVVYGLK